MVSVKEKIIFLIRCLMVGVGIYVGVSLFFLSPASHLNAVIEGAFYDILFRWKPKIESHRDLIIVDANDRYSDDANAARSRGEYARVIKKLANAGVKVIGIDLRFVARRDSSSDDSLVQAAKEYADKLVFAYHFRPDEVPANESALLYHDLTKNIPKIPKAWYDFPPAKGLELPFDPLLTDSSRFGLGHVSYTNEYDNALRRFPVIIRYQQGFYVNLALEMVRRYCGGFYTIEKKENRILIKKENGQELFVPFNENGSTLINFIPNRDFSQYYRMTELPAHLGINFRDSIVLIVNSNREEEWTDATPIGKYPEWALQASLISQILAQSFIQEDLATTLFSTQIIILLCILWLVGFEYRFDKMRNKSWIVPLATNIFYLTYLYVLFCLETRLFVLVPALAISGTYVLMRESFYGLFKKLKFREFVLEVLEPKENKYPVKARTPVGEDTSDVFFPSFLEEKKVKAVFARIQEWQAGREDLQWMGEKLFQAVFQDEVKHLLLRSMELVKRENKYLRVKLSLDPSELVCLPWELMYNSTDPDSVYLALHKRISLVRNLSLDQPVAQTKFTIPLKISVIISSADDLEATKEKALIEEKLKPQTKSRDILLRVCENVTVESLKDEIDRKPDILHYIGHSHFDADKNEAYLEFELENGKSKKVFASTLKYLLSESSVKLIVLNSCRTSEASESDAFTGMAQNLVAVGVPYVVAMQFKIPNDTAIWFSESFYANLLKTNSVDAAVLEARKFIMAKTDMDHQHWATPVLFMRTDNGNIFDSNEVR